MLCIWHEAHWFVVLLYVSNRTIKIKSSCTWQSWIIPSYCCYLHHAFGAVMYRESHCISIM